MSDMERDVMGYWGDGMMTTMLVWRSFGALVLAGLAVGVTLLVSSLIRRVDPPGRASPQPDAVDVLGLRLAQGEIDHEEYERILTTVNRRETPGRAGL